MSKGTLWLARSRNAVCCHCTCKPGLVGVPGQLDCPWCGCGWLFFCITCRKGFTFARPVRVKQTPEELAEADFRGMFKRAPSKKELRQWTTALGAFFGKLDEDEEYCYLDGVLVPISQEQVTVKGLFATHALKRLPQVMALKRPAILGTTLEDVDYWTSRERKKRG